MERKWAIPIALVAVLLLSGVVLAAGTPTVDWWVIGSGGGSASVNGVSLDGTIGQWAVGTSSSGPYELCSGFWGCGEGTERIFLPLTLRGY
jgi:hypothetical protein